MNKYYIGSKFHEIDNLISEQIDKYINEDEDLYSIFINIKSLTRKYEGFEFSREISDNVFKILKKNINMDEQTYTRLYENVFT